jgi:hypothetical protein
MMNPIRSLLCVCLGAAPLLCAQDQPVDIAQLLQALKAIKEQQTQQQKAQHQRALQTVQAAAASPSAAAAAWEEAVRQVQFEGAAREGTHFREWKEKEGAGLDDKDAQNAARLYFVWLGLTLQHSGGAPVKDLLPQVIAYTKEATASAVAMENTEERLKKEREADRGKQGPRDRRNNADDQAVKRIYDRIMKDPLPGSIPVKALKLEELLAPSASTPGAAPADGEGRRGQGQGLSRDWEMAPGNVDGIFQKIILPELRAQHDPRLLEYWDMKIKREGEAAGRSRLAFDAERFNQVRRPELLWNRAEDELALGQRGKAINDMFNLIKNNPAHPNAAAWVSRLESVIAPAPPAAPAGAASAPVSPPGAGAIAPPGPSAVPSPATTPTTPPTPTPTPPTAR